VFVSVEQMVGRLEASMAVPWVGESAAVMVGRLAASMADPWVGETAAVMVDPWVVVSVAY